MDNISKEWYRETFEKYVIAEYESLDVLSQNNSIRDGKIADYMYSQVVQCYHLDGREVKKCINENKKLCSECINKYRG